MNANTNDSMTAIDYARAGVELRQRRREGREQVARNYDARPPSSYNHRMAQTFRDEAMAVDVGGAKARLSRLEAAAAGATQERLTEVRSALESARATLGAAWREWSRAAVQAGPYTDLRAERSRVQEAEAEVRSLEVEVSGIEAGLGMPANAAHEVAS